MELNRERIIRGLACCKGSYDCFTCDIYKRGCAGFREGLARDALALIKQLTEENVRLKEILHTDISFVRVSRGSGKTNHLREVARLRMDAVRADTVREMKDRLINYESYDNGGGNYVVSVDDIRTVAKEMLEGNDG